MFLSCTSIALTLAFTPFTVLGGGCPDGQVEDCADSDCIDDFYIGDGFCDGEDQADGANLCCYENDGGDCDDKQCPDDPGGGGADCSSAIDLVDGAANFDNTDSTVELDLTDVCDLGQFGDEILYKSIWFRWTCPESGSYIASTCNQATYDTRLAIFEN